MFEFLKTLRTNVAVMLFVVNQLNNIVCILSACSYSLCICWANCMCGSVAWWV